MVRRNDFAEAVSALFAIVIFIMIGGVLLQSIGNLSSALGSLTWILILAMTIIFIAVILKLFQVIKNIF